MPLIAGTHDSPELGNEVALPPHIPTTPEEEQLPSKEPTLIIRDSMATATPSNPDMGPEIPESELDDDGLPIENQRRSHFQRAASEFSIASTMGTEVVYPHQFRDQSQPQERQQEHEQQTSPSLNLKQGTLSLSDYLQLGEEALAKFPGRRQEGRVVEAFWEGMGEGSAKQELEERLERGGWVWEVARGVCHDGGDGGDGGYGGETEREIIVMDKVGKRKDVEDVDITGWEASIGLGTEAQRCHEAGQVVDNRGEKEKEKEAKNGEEGERGRGEEEEEKEVYSSCAG